MQRRYLFVHSFGNWRKPSLLPTLIFLLFGLCSLNGNNNVSYFFDCDLAGAATDPKATHPRIQVIDCFLNLQFRVCLGRCERVLNFMGRDGKGRQKTQNASCQMGGREVTGLHASWVLRFRMRFWCPFSGAWRAPESCEKLGPLQTSKICSNNSPKIPKKKNLEHFGCIFDLFWGLLRFPIL